MIAMLLTFPLSVFLVSVASIGMSSVGMDHVWIVTMIYASLVAGLGIVNSKYTEEQIQSASTFEEGMIAATMVPLCGISIPHFTSNLLSGWFHVEVSFKSLFFSSLAVIAIHIFAGVQIAIGRLDRKQKVCHA